MTLNIYNQTCGVFLFLNSVFLFSQANELGFIDVEQKTGCIEEEAKSIGECHPYLNLILNISLEATENIQQVLQKAKKGDTEAQFRIGTFYEYGDFLPQSYSNASHWYNKAMKQGHLKATYKLGKLFNSQNSLDQENASKIYLAGLSKYPDTKTNPHGF